MRIAVVWYSRTGTTAHLVRDAAVVIGRLGHEVGDFPIRPRFELPYPLWLALSFIPGSRFPLQAQPPEVPGFDACLLALPKWTFSCPPANSFLAACRALPPTSILVTCGGWDEERYVRALENRLRRGGATVLGGLALKRRHVESGECRSRLEGFLEGCFPPDAA